MPQDVALAGHRDAEVILDCISDGVMTIDLGKRVTFVNKALRELLGIDEPHDGQLLACDMLIHSTICSSHQCVFERALRGERVSNFEASLRRHDGHVIPVSINTDFLCDDEGQLIGLVEVIRDISSSHELSSKIAEVHDLRHRLGEHVAFHNLVGESEAMREVVAKLPSIAMANASTLITGESGTGKELVACALHANSARKHGPFVAVNCSSLSPGILESELFGHVRGAFTGAYQDKIGRFERAKHGTIFLDELGDIDLSTQVKLLRVLERGELERVGSSETIHVDVRVVAATHRDLNALVRAGHFREDLLYRIRVLSVSLPPLRERKEDLPILVTHFLRLFNDKMSRTVERLSSECLEMLKGYDFPGNVRELQNILEHAFVCCPGDVIDVEHLPQDVRTHRVSSPGQESAQTLRALEQESIVKMLEQTGWRYTETAKRLGIGRSTLWRKIKQYGIKKDTYDGSPEVS